MGAALERVLRDGPGVANRARIAAPLLDLIARDMLRLGPPHRGFAGLPAATAAASPASDLPARLLAFVVDGADPQMLAPIRAVGWSISSHDNDAKARGVRWQLYDHWEELPPTVLVRFARVLAAGSGLVVSDPALELSRLHPWVETLVRDLVGLPVSHRLFAETSCRPHGKASIERLAAVLEAGDLTLAAFLRSAFTSKLGSTRANSVDFVGSLRGFGAALAQHKPTLTDADDNRVTLTAEATVCLAHDTNCEPLVRQAWLKHFKDYGLLALFQQFGKGCYALPEDRREITALGDFEGHMLDAYKLRGAATRLGYMRGAAEDGGWVYQYTKRFASPGVEAVVGFSGNPLPEENRKVALTSLRFQHGRGGEVPLGEVPAGLLSECWNEMRLIAAEGSGFDPDWQNKVAR
jgi:Domain of unknown function (DUF4132)